MHSCVRKTPGGDSWGGGVVKRGFEMVWALGYPAGLLVGTPGPHENMRLSATYPPPAPRPPLSVYMRTINQIFRGCFKGVVEFLKKIVDLLWKFQIFGQFPLKMLENVKNMHKFFYFGSQFFSEMFVICASSNFP